jgi:alkanesulfonate monooxygenase SsuD/methylene tetrahydromethanopterin reductase-like flavin-dependent oxidoreductase (luciferase family)
MSLVSLMYPVHVANLGDCIPFARLIQQRGKGRFWLGQSLRIETHHAFAALAASGIRVPCGSAVTLTPLRHPYHQAVEARSVAIVSGHPYVCGIGPGATVFQAALWHAPYQRPATETEVYARTVRALLDGEERPAHGESFVANRARLTSAPGAPHVEIALGVLREAMARAAGRAADCAVTWLAPLAYVTDTLMPTSVKAAQAVGRTEPRYAAILHCAVDRPGRDPVGLAFASVGVHLAQPHYTAMLKSAGVPCDPSAPAAGARALVERQVFTYGTPEQIAARISEYHVAGVDEVVLSVAGVYNTRGRAAALRDFTEILAACDGEASK